MLWFCPTDFLQSCVHTAEKLYCNCTKDKKQVSLFPVTIISDITLSKIHQQHTGFVTLINGK